MNPKGITYRIEKATAADAQAIKRLVRGARLDPTDLRWQNFRVARREDHILGCVQLKRYPGLQELASLVVRRRFRGQGIGQALVREILADVAQPPVYLICPTTGAASTRKPVSRWLTKSDNSHSYCGYVTCRAN